MREKIIEILNEICPGNDFENETAIIDDGIIDSLDQRQYVPVNLLGSQ